VIHVSCPRNSDAIEKWNTSDWANGARQLKSTWDNERHFIVSLQQTAANLFSRRRR